MNKKIISLVLALVMVLGTFTSVFAAEPTKKAEAKKEEVKKTETKKAEAGEKVEKVVGKDNKIQYVIDKKLVEGYEDGTYGLDKNIKRSEITRLLVLANGNEELSKQLQGSMKIYSDVDAKHWANGVITVGTTVPSDANGIAMLAGYPDGSFKPEKDVTYAELSKMLVVLAKKDLTADMVKNAKWASDWMTWAAQLGILNDVTVNDSDKAANRADAFTMIYNALYTMKEFKRVPANETRGIISSFSKDTLQLNQDSKMEYKVNADTVFVTGKNNAYSQIQKIGQLNLSAKAYYYGSLVRILTNDKNEVTHIIELGNPKHLALSQYNQTNEVGLVKGNTVWRDVADNTIETVNNTDVRTADQAQKGIKDTDVYATVDFGSGNIKAKNIVFHNVEQKDAKVELKLTDKTEFYVANPANNIMKKVANINEALSLIGYQNYKEYKLAGVYAGFDTDAAKTNYSAIKFDTKDRHTAKVVVFNFVNKAFEGDKFRVVESTSSKGDLTLENTDGKLMDVNQLANITRFPLSYGDKLDIVSVIGQNITTELDHSNKKAFPVVRITDVTNDGKTIEVIDEAGVRTVLDIRDADVFSAQRYGKLEKDNFIQFRVENKDSNVADLVSLLGTKDVRLEGSLVGICPVIQLGQQKGVVTEVGMLGNYLAFTVTEENSLTNGNKMYHYAHYVTYGEKDGEMYKLLNEYKASGEAIAYKVTGQKEEGRLMATDIKNEKSGLLLANHKERETTVKTDLDAVKGEELNVNADDGTLAKVKGNIETAVKAKAVNTEVEVEILEPKKDKDFKANDELKVKVTLTSKKAGMKDAKLDKEITIKLK
ncbi:S-layer homology domain-containing protein [Peptoniphilus vaginalis]|uniref:S-layer homology domain-containing protein n=1 Tax=Peptoniphilus vaginalis TaxID=1756987 RepID=UPI0023F991A3|nr:S-layer homology domain-containing protein [Peptoniphilus vaginalis]